MSDSEINIPQPLLQALSVALIKKLNPATLQKITPITSDVTAPSQTIKESVVNELLANLLSNGIASPRTPGIAALRNNSSVQSTISPGTPQSTKLNLTPNYIRMSDVRTPTSSVVNLPGSPLSRTSSNCSSVSTLSDSSAATPRSFNETQDEDVVFIKRRKSSTAQELADSKVVTVPILTHFDANWLARDPKNKDNPMYEFRVRTAVGFGSQPLRKKFADMVVPFFKRESRSIIRRLVTSNLRHEQELDPTITYEELRKRYETAALKVVRKRRANHVQSWRPDKRGTHCPLIYGGVVPASYSMNNDKPQSQVLSDITIVTNKAEPQSSAEATKNAEPKPRAGATKNAEPKENTTGVVFLQKAKVLTCKECEIEMTPTDAYPKERWGADCDGVWCSKCWREEQKKMVREHIKNVQKRKAKLKELQKWNNDENRDTPPPQKRQKKASYVAGIIKTCKWCGSTTHSRKSSLECPYNKSKKKKEDVEESQTECNGDEEDEETPEEFDEETPEEGDEEDEETPEECDEETPPTGKTTTPSNPEAVQSDKPSFKVGDNVIVTFGKKVFLAQLFKIQGAKYHVYYVGNGESDVVSLKHLSPDKWKTRTRADYLNTEFYCDGLVADPDNGLDPIAPGRWKVRRVAGNEFVCVRLSGGGPSDCNIENFDISYVMGEVRAEEEYVRERGPFCKGRH